MTKPATKILLRTGKALALMGLLALGSCADMDEQQQKMVSGGAIGAVVGTVGVAITGGCIPCGTVIDKTTKSSPSTSSSSGSYSSSSYPNGSYPVSNAPPPPPPSSGPPPAYGD
jgi:hypothetical protein